MTAIKLKGQFNQSKSIVDMIKNHINSELAEYKSYLDSNYEDSFQDALFEGRAEYAETLKKQINEWENS